MNVAADVKYWLWLGTLAGVSARTAKALTDLFGNPYEVWRQPTGVFARLGFLSRQAVAQLTDPAARAGLDERVAALRARGIEIVTPEDARYPEHIRQIADPPTVLFMRGERPAAPGERAVAVVGARHPSAYGLAVTKKLVSGLVAYGFTIASGLAMGIDAAAHAEAIASGGKTIAFLGCGVEQAYPASNRRLMEEVLRRGAVYSEYPPGTPPLSYHFPQRNRLVSGMSLGVLVVEAGEKSGALITAGLAGEQGRDVFAAPGNITSPLSRGTNALLRDGAGLVTSAEDVVFALNPYFDGGPWTGPPPSATAAASAKALTAARAAGLTERIEALDGPERDLARLLRDRGPLDHDALAALGGLGAREVGAAVIKLELKGLIRRTPNGLCEVAGD
ncbi:MAG: DNA-processing protein DprA [Clostridiales bacterium]|jgi:DNA processing protein|nr:DNA-processing protein DprA [Clostridiales bacterium]